MVVSGSDGVKDGEQVLIVKGPELAPATFGFPVRDVDETEPQRQMMFKWFRQYLRYIGPGYMVAVGYMDPGNWATDLSAGSQFYYRHLFAILLSNVFANILQALAIKAGVVSGLDLAQLCRHHFSRSFSLFLYATCEIAIIACDLAEVIGSAFALQLLFGIPLGWGTALTSLDVLVVLMGFGPKHLKKFEIGIMALIGILGVCFVILLIKTVPNAFDVFSGFIPSASLFQDQKQLYLLLGILGATVMPHNLYLHSHLVIFRAYFATSDNDAAAEEAAVSWDQADEIEPTRSILSSDRISASITLATIDSGVALLYALFVNCAILIVAAAAFFHNGMVVDDIPSAFMLLSKQLGPTAGILFAVALLCSGQSSTITATLAGQIIMAGFLPSWCHLKAWQRRLVSRLLAIIPAMVVVLMFGSNGISDLLILSQVVLSLQLPFAMWPLIWITSTSACMTVCDENGISKSFANGWPLTIVSVICAVIITALNFLLLFQVAFPSVFG